MASDFLASVLVEAIRDTGMLPAPDESTNTAKIIAVMNREQRVYLTRLLLSARESYQTASADIIVESGVSSYPIPSRAVGAKLKMVERIDSEGLPTLLNPIPPVRRSDNRFYGSMGDYYLEANRFVLTDSPRATGTIRLTYFRRLNKIVPADEAAEISAINTVARTATLIGSTVPDDFETTATSYDLVQANPHFDVVGASMSATRSGQVLTFTDELPDDLAVGDYVALAGETPICNAPLELHDVLVQRAVVKVLEAKGDPKLQTAKAMLDELRADAVALISPRVEDTPPVLINYNAPGWNRWRGGRWRGGR